MTLGDKTSDKARPWAMRLLSTTGLALALLLPALLLAPAWLDDARAATIAMASNTKTPLITIDGNIEPGDEARFRELADKAGKATVLLYGNGGKTAPAIEIGRMIKARGMGTAVANGFDCANACGLIWLAGTPRFLAKSSRVGIPSNVDRNSDDPVASYVTLLNLPEKTQAFTTTVDSKSTAWLTTENANDAGIAVSVLGAPAPAAAAPTAPAPAAPAPAATAAAAAPAPAAPPKPAPAATAAAAPSPKPAPAAPATPTAVTPPPKPVAPPTANVAAAPSKPATAVAAAPAATVAPVTTAATAAPKPTPPAPTAVATAPVPAPAKPAAVVPAAPVAAKPAPVAPAPPVTASVAPAPALTAKPVATPAAPAAASPVTATAPVVGDTPFATAGAWEIRRGDASVGGGCYAMANYAPDIVLIVGYDLAQKSVFLNIGSERLQPVDPTKSYAMQVRFDNHRPWDSQAEVGFSNKVKFMMMTFHAGAFMNEFMNANGMTLREPGKDDDKDVLKLNLPRSGAAAREILRCQGGANPLDVTGEGASAKTASASKTR